MQLIPSEQIILKALSSIIKDNDIKNPNYITRNLVNQHIPNIVQIGRTTIYSSIKGLAEKGVITLETINGHCYIIHKTDIYEDIVSKI